MKAQCICLVAFFISSSLPARQPAIAIKVIGGANKHISYLKRVVGRYFPNLPTEDTLNANGELVLPNTETVYIADQVLQPGRVSCDGFRKTD